MEIDDLRALQAQVRAGVPPTTDDGLNTMTPAQQRRAIEKRARELETARRAAERERKAQERARLAAERQREKTMETTIRTVGRVASSSAGQSLLRGVFGTIFGTGKRGLPLQHHGAALAQVGRNP